MKKQDSLFPALLSCAAAALLTVSCTPEQGEADSGSQAGSRPGLDKVDLAGVDKLHATDGFYLASQPGEETFAALKEKGVKTVINLRKPEEKNEFDEAKVLDGLGLAYVHLPWNGPEEMTDELIDESRELLRQAEKPLVLHCASSNRVGALWIPYRVLDEGVPLEQAVKEAKQAGLKTAEYEAKARAYVAERR